LEGKYVKLIDNQTFKDFKIYFILQNNWWKSFIADIKFILANYFSGRKIIWDYFKNTKK